MKSEDIRQKFLDFFKKRGHTIVPSSSLIPDDPSVLLTTAGMQQFKPYFTGQADPIKDFGSKNTTSIQKSFRTTDIDEVGDENHLTFFEMLGNFSFGGYFKKEAIEIAHELLISNFQFPISNTSVTVFKGDKEIPSDEESVRVWNTLGFSEGKGNLHFAGREDNFWGPTGEEGPCGPTTEIMIGKVEIWNIVFNEYYCQPDKSLKKLETPGVDTGMGLERLAMVLQKKKNIFETDLFSPILNEISIGLDERKRRIIADHVRGIAFLISDGVIPSNQGSGYVLRRLIRRIQVYNANVLGLLKVVYENYKDFYPELNIEKILLVYNEEYSKFSKTLTKGLKELKKLDKVSTKDAFNLYQTFGLPYEVIKDVGGPEVRDLCREDFDKEFERHQEISKAGAEHKFKGGLADTKPETIRLHTTHHLLLASLQKILGSHVKQRGSNITAERLRLDFSHTQKMSEEEIKKVEDLVNQKIKEGLDVVCKEMSKEEALKIGAEMEFGAKYGDIVSVYIIGDKKNNVFSKEFCGGPHVSNTREIGNFKIIKEEAVSAGVRRIRATIE